MSPARATFAARWRALAPAQRRRIVMGGLLVASLAARDLVLFVFTAGLFGLAEAGSARPVARATA